MVRSGRPSQALRATHCGAWAVILAEWRCRGVEPGDGGLLMEKRYDDVATRKGQCPCPLRAHTFEMKGV
ncbi:hypothetical protein GOP47_0022951 [Adiantum capillus-veneris]|uniref:Uncharacterized protein n=1 Tax=Adiantum capillus-veneris TaxID=13818 RepID=A0A9D4U7G7_ADICA|nr:hypothetical protein GOP47_0022951 [Adiantum capillus-veneris]